MPPNKFKMKTVLERINPFLLTKNTFSAFEQIDIHLKANQNETINSISHR